MNIRVRLASFRDGRDFVIIVKCPSVDQCRGKYVVGHYSIDPRITAVVLDSSASFHPWIVKKYRLVAVGGGHFAIDRGESAIHLSGISDTYGAEPDRRLTAMALEAALPTFRVVID